MARLVRYLVGFQMLVAVLFPSLATGQDGDFDKFPNMIMECDGDQCTSPRGGGGAIWVFEGKHGQAKWHYGAIADLTIESFDGRKVVIRRVDPAGSYSSRFAAPGQLFTAVYTGTIDGDLIEGTVSWGGTWYAKIPKTPCRPVAECPLDANQTFELGQNAARAKLNSAARRSFLISAAQGNASAEYLISQLPADTTPAPSVQDFPKKREVKPVNPSPALTFRPGKYYALVIGNNDYQHLPKLQTAVNDATEVARVLQHNYGFVEPKVLLNATRDEILTELNVFRSTLPENSNLVIYYAGHGHKDRDTGKAYWLPVDARADNDVKWISSSTITEEISALHSSHILVISDSCYSGALTRGAKIEINPADYDSYLKKMLESRSRTLMASGGNEPVADSGASGHSKFASVLIDSLVYRVDKDRFTANYLFEEFVRPWVSGQSDQSPQYSPIQGSGNEYGDFVFSRQKF